MTWRVLVADPVDPSGLTSLSSIDVEIVSRPGLSESQIVEIIGTFDALIVRSGVKVTKAILEAGTKLRIVGRAGVGVDNIDVSTATRLGIYVVNSPFGNVIAAAEHTLGLMLAAARKIPTADASVRRGEWTRPKFVGVQLAGRTLGIVGLGQVGSHLAKIAIEMGMVVFVYDPFVNEEKAKSLGCTLVSLDRLTIESDFITLHVPLNNDTRHMFDANRLKMMKSTSYLINVSRGGVVNEADLCEALNADRIAGAALDVFENEKSFDLSSELVNAKNLVLTPHLGASTSEAQSNVAVDVAEQIRTVLEGSLPRSAVNIPGLRASEVQSGLVTSMKVGEVLGRVAVQLLRGALVAIDVVLESQSQSTENYEPILMAVAQGALAMHTAGRVNFVNIRDIASRSKLKLSITKKISLSSRDCVCVKLTSATDSSYVRGSLSHREGRDPSVLLREFGDTSVYVHLPTHVGDGGVMLWSQHEDVPGALAAITKVIGDQKLNISNCHLGRRHLPSGKLEGLAIFDLDGLGSPEVLKELRALPIIRDCDMFIL